ncbi:MAG: hypothetical protein RLZZ46_1010 [Bacteroidota bacterium]|jgi:gliding motility-associated-like protein
MKYRFLLYFFLFFSPWSAISQVVINTTSYVIPSPQQSLVQNVLLGNGVSASNFTFQGDASALGFFKGIGTNLGLDSGVVMSTGNVQDINGTNLIFASTDHLSNTPNDADINTILNGVAANDVAILEFDFIPQGDTVKFDYIFGSEEYPEFVCQFNDVFGFFLSGPGISGPFANGAENIALVPGTTTPVTIDNVNGGFNNDPNDPTCPAVNPQFYLINNGNDFSLDGYTTVLQAISAVQCGQTYHVKLVIADALDDGFDSGVFLKARSFVSSAVLINATTLSGDTTIVEGCANATFQFTRPANATGDSLVVNFNILGTAINGTDYTQIPDSVLFLPGQSSVDITIQPLSDGITESTETIILELVQNICGIFTQQSILYIVNPVPLSIVLQDTSLNCPTDSITLAPIIQGGYPPYFFSWSSGQTTPSITVSPDSSISYFLIVSDTCGPYTDSDSVSVSVPFFTPPSYNITGGAISCPNFGVTINAGVGGGFPPYTFSWYELDPNFPFPIFISGDSTVIVFPTVTTQYVVEISDACDPLAIYRDTVTVDVNLIPQISLVANAPAANGYLVEGCATGLFNFSYQPTGTFNDSITVFFTISGTASNGVDYSQIPDSVIIPSGQTNTNLSVTAFSDALQEGIETIIISYYQNACNYPAQTDTLFIDNLQPIQITNTDQTLICPGDTAIISASFTGGYPPYTFLWNTGSTADSIIVSPGSTTTYTLTVSDTCGPSTDTQNISIIVPTFSPLIVQATDAVIDCPGAGDTITANVSGGFIPYNYTWTLNANFIGNDSSVFIVPGIGSVYVITVTDECGSPSSQDTVGIIQLPYQIPEISGSDITVNCPGEIAILSADVTGGRSPFVFNWNNGQIGINTSSLQVSSDQTESFTISVTDACNSISNTDTINYFVPIYDAITVVSRLDTIVCPGYVLSLPASASGGSGAYTFNWSSNSDLISQTPGPVSNVTVNAGGTYLLTATDECGNTGVAQVNVEMLTACEVEEVNVFTPNGDGKNESLIFKNLEFFQNSKLTVYNRWGEKVYEDENYQNNWSGDNLSSGTYYFNLVLSEKETKTGFFKLLK